MLGRFGRPMTAAVVVLSTAGLSVATTSSANAAGSWSTGPTMAGAHTSFVGLADGRVLAVGNAAPEIYSPLTGLFTTAGADPDAIAAPATTALTGGGALLVGTAGTAGAAEIFTTNGVWQKTGPLAQAGTSDVVTSLSNGGALVLDGNDAPTGTAEILDPTTMTWAATGSTGHHYAGPVLLTLSTGDVLVAGATTDGHAAAEVWSHQSGAWRDVAAPPVQLSSWGLYPPAATLLSDGEVFVASGVDHASNMSFGQSLIYDPTHDSWRQAGSPIDPHRPVAVAPRLPSGRVLLVGEGTSPSADETAESYDPGTDLWSGAGVTPAAYLLPLAAVTGLGTVLVGEQGSTSTSRYLPTDTSAASAPTTGGAPVDLFATMSHQHQSAGPENIIGHLMTQAAREPVAGEEIDLYERQAGSSDWTKTGQATTDAAGAVVFGVSRNVAARYTLRHPGSAAAAPAASPDLVISAPASTTPTRPAPPVSIATVPSDTSIDVYWVSPDDDGGAPITGYVISVNGAQAATAQASDTHVRLTQLDNATSYTIGVAAQNSVGTGNPATTTDQPSAGRAAPPVATLCGRLDGRANALTAVGSPYLLCPAGLVLSPGAALKLDTSAGAVTVNALAGGPAFSTVGAFVMEGADLYTTGNAGVTLHGGVRTTTWMFAPPDLSADAANSINVHHVTIDGSGLAVTSALDVHAHQLAVTPSSGAGAIRITDTWTELDHPVVAHAADAISLDDHHGGRPYVVTSAVVSNAIGAGLSATAVDDLTVHGVTVTHSALAVSLSDDQLRLGGDAPAITGLTGADNDVNAVVLDGTESGDFTWVSPVATSGAPQPLGYLLGRLRTAPDTTVTVPADAVVKGIADPPYGASLALGDGSRLDASAGGAVFTSSTDDSVGMPTCHSNLAGLNGNCWPGSTDWWGIGGGKNVTVMLTGATIEHASHALSAGTGSTVTVDHTLIQQVGAGIDTAGYEGGNVSTLTVADSTIRDVVGPSFFSFSNGTGIYASCGSTTVSRTTIDNASDMGIYTDECADGGATLTQVAIHGSGGIAAYLGESGTYDCLNITDNHGGVLGHDDTATVSLSNSDLTGNVHPGVSPGIAGYDVDDQTAATTTGVWWGQPGGPVTGQVSNPGALSDTAPASAQVPCAQQAGDPRSLPPAAPARLDVVREGGQVVASWPTVSGATGYRVYRTDIAGGTGALIANPSTTTFTDTGLPNAAEYYNVTAVNAQGEGLSTEQVRAALFTSGPPPVTNQTMTTFTWPGPSPAPTCVLDGQPVDCATATKYGGVVSSGAHVFSVTTHPDGGGTATTTAHWLVDTSAPTIEVTSPRSPVQASTIIAVTHSWADSGGGGLRDYEARYRSAAWNGGFGGYVYPAGWQHTTAATLTLHGSPGHEYCVSERARDNAGNLSGWSPERCTAVPLDDRALHASTSGWTRATSSRYYLGTYTRTTQQGATLTLPNAQLDRLALVVTTCPSCGHVAIYLNGHYFTRVSTYSATTRLHVIVLTTPFAQRTATVAIKATDAGKPVVIDGIGMLRA